MSATTVDITPTPDEYERVARTLLASCADDFTPERRASALHILSEAVHLVAYLTTLDDGAARLERLKLFTLALGVHVCEVRR